MPEAGAPLNTVTPKGCPASTFRPQAQYTQTMKHGAKRPQIGQARFITLRMAQDIDCDPVGGA